MLITTVKTYAELILDSVTAATITGIRDCHTPGLDSIVLLPQGFNGSKLVRMYVAWGSQLHRLLDDQRNYIIAPHNHRCDIDILPVVGEISNITATIRAGGGTHYQYTYHSEIIGGSGIDTATMSRAYLTQSAPESITPGQMLSLEADDIHTIMVADSHTVTAWIVIERGYKRDYTYLYASKPLTQLPTKGLYAAMEPGEALGVVNRVRSLLGHA